MDHLVQTSTASSFIMRRMKRCFVILIMLLTLVGTAHAQFLDPEALSFVQEIATAMESGDYNRAIDVIKKDPDRAERVFNSVYRLAGSYPGGMREVGPGLSAVAFVLDTECGRSGPKQQLENAGSYSPAPGLVKLSENPSSAPLATGDLANAEIAEIALRTGNYSLAQSMLTRLEDTPENRVNLLYAYSAVGRASAAEAILPALPKDKAVNLIKLYAARRAERPKQVREQLESLAGAPHTGFITKTFQTEQDLIRQGELDPSKLMAAHRDAWVDFDTAVSNITEPGQARVVGEAARFWLLTLFLHMQMVGPDHPSYSALNSALEDDVKRFHLAAGEGIRGQIKDLESLKDFNPDLAFSFFTAIDDLGNLKIQFGDTGSVRSELNLVKYYVENLVIMAEGFDQLLALRYSQHDVQPSLLEGEISQGAAAYNQTWARLLLSEGSQKVSEIEEYLNKADKHQERARLGIGFRGMREVGWDRLDLLAATLPNGWVERSLQTVEPLIKTSRELDYRPGLIAGLTARGELRLEQGNPTGAESDLSEAVNLFEQYLREADLSREAETRAIKESGRAYELLAGIRISQGNSAGAFTLLDQRQQASASIEAGEIMTRSTRSLRDKKERIHVLEAESSRLKESSDPDAAAQLEVVTQELATTKQEHQALLAQLKTAEPRFYNQLTIDPVEFDDLRASIPADAAVVQLFPTSEKLYLLVGTRDGLTTRSVDVKSKDLNQAVNRLRRSISKTIAAGSVDWSKVTRDSLNPNLKELTSELSLLHSYLVQPVEDLLQNKKTIAFLPSGKLHYVPFSSLGKFKANGQFEFLIERSATVVLVKASDFLGFQKQASKDLSRMVVVGNPDGTLPYAEKEALELAGLFPQAKALVGNAATPANLRHPSGSMQSLHLATHGVLNGSQPSFSYLVMGNDTRLRPSQILDLPLEETRLVSLSACNTAVGKRTPGREVASLAESFSLAGGENLTLLASLWEVSDDSTRKLMLDFYTRSKTGAPLGESFRQAQLALLKDPETGHPYHWAAFHFWGDWR
jgi:CHAT domain-containing protein